MITLYDYELSTECYLVRLFLSILDVEYERIDVELYPSKEHESAWFSELNPLRDVPVVQEGDVVLRDSHAIATLLAHRYDPSGAWLPIANALLHAGVVEWLGIARVLSRTAGAARWHQTLANLTEVDAPSAEAHRVLAVIDQRLWFSEHRGSGWIGQSDLPTIADLAVFAEVAVTEEGGIHHIDYPAVRRWMDRVKRIEGFVGMPGIFPIVRPAGA